MPKKKKNAFMEMLEEKYSLADVALARRFVMDHNAAMYDSSTYHTPIRYVENVGFVFYDGVKWVLPDDAKNSEKNTKIKAYKYLIESLDNYKIELKNELDELERKAVNSSDSAIQAHIEFLEEIIEKFPANNDRKIQCVLNQAPGIEGMLMQLKAFDRLDTSDPLTFKTLNTPAGLIDLRTGQLYKDRVNRYITKCTPYDYTGQYHYDKDGRCFWLDFVHEILPDPIIRDWFERFIGYSLCAIKDKELFAVMYGPGGNGKTTLIECIKKALGRDYAVKVDTKSVMSAYKSMSTGDEASPSTADLQGARMAFLSEAKAVETFDSAKIKDLTGGGEIRTRRLYSNSIIFPATHQLFLDSNKIPKLTDVNDEGFKRRLVKPSYKPDFKARIYAVDTIKDCFQWLIDCAIKYHREGLPTGPELPAVMRNMLADYYSEQDYVGQFLAEKCDIYDSNGRESASKVYEAFKKWFLDCWGSKVISQTTFGGQLLPDKAIIDGKEVSCRHITMDDGKEVTIYKKKSGGSMWYHGLRLKNE